MRVIKFGGSSLATPDRLETVIRVISQSSATEPVVVVTSAVGDTTEALVSVLESCRVPSQAWVDDLVGTHLGLFESQARWLSLHQGRISAAREESRSCLRERLLALVEPVMELGRKAEASGEWTPQDRDRVLGTGERTAALLLAELLTTAGVQARPVDGWDVIRTDSSFGAARVDANVTRRLARWTLRCIHPKSVPVVAGFTGGDKLGRPTTLGRGSSDLTAALLAAALGARIVEIWTDVDGVCKVDPKEDPLAVPHPYLDYASARSLARNGARILHPATLDPLEGPGIPLHVRNTLRPSVPGTWVGRRECRVKGDTEARTIHLILAGATGGVGSEFLSQLDNLSPSLMEEGLKVRVAGAFSSRSQYWDPEGIPPGEVRDSLEFGCPPDWDELAHRIVSHPPSNPVFVDCTASTKVSEKYLPILQAGVPLVTPNKLASSGPLSLYRSIRDEARKQGLPYRYETTVGAALPILRTVRDLKETGDSFRSIQGVLSGTLSFVFGKLTTGVRFSEAVREARDRGFTEPHPREDLSGADVGRKLLILLREAGVEVEPEDIPVESLVPRELGEVEDPREFLARLGRYDGAWESRVRNAEGHALSYVAWFDGKTAGVGVRALSAHDPLSALRPTENRVVLVTDRYPEVPLTIAGPGAGREITASGVLTDFLEATRERYGKRRVA